MNKLNFKKILYQLKWILLGGGPIFFFVRAIYLASTGGDTFSTINPIFSWFLLFSEISLSGIAGSVGIICLILWKEELNQIKLQYKKNLKKIGFFTGISTYVVHFIRVAIWLSL
ncbi:MAG: hypothetical protein JSV23_07220 [Promethearchaeota archaeon]|nr:MAG: hypothetical protein JSV23_07220 [Candidatus Lokiarchaeota archaeon]